MRRLSPLELNSLAHAAHEVNRAYCRTLGDDTQVAWDDAPDWQKKSALDGVLFLMSNPNARPAESHERWLSHKLADGWTYGPEKNVELKQHPCMVEYKDLPAEQQIKDSMFTGVVKAMLDAYWRAPA